MIFGLAYNPASGVLYGVSKPNATVSGFNLWTINPATGATTLVGSLGIRMESLTWSATHGLIGAFEDLYSINIGTAAVTQIGGTSYNNGVSGAGLFNGLYALAAIPPAAPAGSFEIVSVTHSAGQIEVEWTSETGFNYQLEFSVTGTAESWTPVSAILPGTAGTMSATHTPGGPVGLYVVRTTP